jgi:hypothetical protein
VSDPLFAVLPGPAGQLRTLLNAEVATATGAGAVLPADLVLVCAHLADRIDWAVAGRQYRGFVMLTAEYRAARRELFGDLGAADDSDGFADALAALSAAEAGHTAGPLPGH